MSEEEILKECTELAENEHHELGDCWDEEYSSSAIFGLIMLYKQTKKELTNLKEIEKSHQEENGLLRQELDMQIEHNKELEATLKQTQDSWFEDTQKLEQEKEKNKKLEEYITDKIEIEDEIQTYISEKFVEDQYISKDKIREKLELLKDILKAKEKDGHIYKQIPIEYLKGAIEQLEELLEEK